jgi:glutamate-1-semialdehyde 2,1-aminomutase
VYQAGTLSGNPLAMAAGLTTLRALLEPGVFDHIERTTHELVAGIEGVAHETGVAMQTGCAGSMFGFYFLSHAGARITDYESAKAYADTSRYARFFHAMLERGFYFAPSQFEAAFVSAAHSEDDVRGTVAAVREALTEVVAA